jgi:2,3-dihydroxybiphenyl 1,2-dioxygenase
MSSVKELGYIGIEASDLSAWERFGVDLIGLQVAQRSENLLTFRMDQKVHRVIIEQGPADDVAYFGYECGTEADLETLVRRLQDNGFGVEPGDEALTATRGVDRIAVTADPMGNRLELYVGLHDAGTPFSSPLNPSGFQTVDGGAGHSALVSPDRQAALDFYALLGFRISDYILQEVGPGQVLDIAFTHCNGRHHTQGFVAVPSPKKMHHFMVEVNDRDDVGVAFDRALEAKAPIGMTIGMHPNDKMFSFYLVTPSGFLWEYGAGGVLITDDDAWDVQTYQGISTWGHKPPQLLASALA